jgi:hypothetical protein
VWSCVAFELVVHTVIQWLYFLAFSFFELGASILAVMWKVYCWNVLRELLEDVPFLCVLDVLEAWKVYCSYLTEGTYVISCCGCFLLLNARNANIPRRRE